MSDKVAHTLIEQKQVDFGKTSEDYAVHRPGFPDSFYARLRAFTTQANLAQDGACCCYF